jgi:hypothetical protein
MRRLAILVSVVAVASSGCATRVVREPARQISADVASLQSQLSSFQDDWGAYQETQRLRTGGYMARAAAAQTNDRQLRAQLSLLSAPNETAALEVLDTTGEEEARLAAGPAPEAEPVKPTKFQIDKLGEFVGITDGLAKGRPASEEVKALIAYLKTVNTQLASAQGAAVAAAVPPTPAN